MIVALRRMWIQLTADRRRLAILCAALGVGMLLWGRLIVVSRMPRVALAEDEKQVSKGVPGSESPSAAGAGLDEWSRPDPIQIELSTRAQRDPFVISPRYFPKPTSFTSTPQTADKSPGNTVEDSVAAEARISAALQQAINQLRLEAAVNGSMAIINGRTFRIGEDVKAELGTSGAQGSGERIIFRLAEVRQRSAILEWEERQFEIRMASP